MNFRELHNTVGPGATWAGPIAKWGDATEKSTWEGYAHCFEDAMRAHPWLDGESLESLRAGLAYIEDAMPFASCGEEHPRMADNMEAFVGTSDRRIEAVFVKPNAPFAPSFCHSDEKHCDPGACPLQKPTIIASEVIPLAPPTTWGEFAAMTLWDPYEPDPAPPAELPSYEAFVNAASGYPRSSRHTEPAPLALMAPVAAPDDDEGGDVAHLFAPTDAYKLHGEPTSTVSPTSIPKRLPNKVAATWEVHLAAEHHEYWISIEGEWTDTKGNKSPLKEPYLKSAFREHSKLPSTRAGFKNDLLLVRRAVESFPDGIHPQPNFRLDGKTKTQKGDYRGSDLVPVPDDWDEGTLAVKIRIIQVSPAYKPEAKELVEAEGKTLKGEKKFGKFTLKLSGEFTEKYELTKFDTKLRILPDYPKDIILPQVSETKLTTWNDPLYDNDRRLLVRQDHELRVLYTIESVKYINSVLKVLVSAPLPVGGGDESEPSNWQELELAPAKGNVRTNDVEKAATSKGKNPGATYGFKLGLAAGVQRCKLRVVGTRNGEPYDLDAVEVQLNVLPALSTERQQMIDALQKWMPSSTNPAKFAEDGTYISGVRAPPEEKAAVARGRAAGAKLSDARDLLEVAGWTAERGQASYDKWDKATKEEEDKVKKDPSYKPVRVPKETSCGDVMNAMLAIWNSNFIASFNVREQGHTLTPDLSIDSKIPRWQNDHEYKVPTRNHPTEIRVEADGREAFYLLQRNGPTKRISGPTEPDWLDPKAPRIRCVVCGQVNNRAPRCAFCKSDLPESEFRDSVWDTNPGKHQNFMWDKRGLPGAIERGLYQSWSEFAHSFADSEAYYRDWVKGQGEGTPYPLPGDLLVICNVSTVYQEHVSIVAGTSPRVIRTANGGSGSLPEQACTVVDGQVFLQKNEKKPSKGGKPFMDLCVTGGSTTNPTAKTCIDGWVRLSKLGRPGGATERKDVLDNKANRAFDRFKRPKPAAKP